MYAAVPAAFDSGLVGPVSASDVLKSHSNCNDDTRETQTKWGVDVVVTACDVHAMEDFTYLFTL